MNTERPAPAESPVKEYRPNRAARRKHEKTIPRAQRMASKRLRREFAVARKGRTPDEMIEWLHGRLEAFKQAANTPEDAS